jgi:hypothetical protein
MHCAKVFCYQLATDRLAQQQRVDKQCMCVTVASCLLSVRVCIIAVCCAVLCVVLCLQWPAQEGGFVVPPAPGYIQLGVSIEPLAELSAKEGSRLGERALQQLAADSMHCAAPCDVRCNCSSDTDMRKQDLFVAER